MIVVDASVAVKWMVWESDTPDALEFLFMHRRSLCGPDLLFVEVANAITKQARRVRGIGPDALSALQRWSVAWEDHAIGPYRVTQRRLRHAGELSLRLDHSIYDCIYLALAMELSAELATCDAKFFAKANKVYPAIRMLGDYSK